MRPAPALRLGAVLAAAVLAACTGGTGTPPGPSNDLLIIGYDREPDVLNRFSTHILEDIHSCIIEGLTTTDEHMNVIPVLAQTVPTVENGDVRLRPDGGMDVTWRLRPAVAWHDGVPHTAEDVKFTVEALNDPEYNPESTDGFDRIDSVTVRDSLTAVVHYREVYAPYALQFFRGTLPKHLLEGRDIDRATDYNRDPLGTGPYRVAEWRTGEYILLERVDHYWQGDSLPKIRQLMFKFLPNTNTRINQLRSGEIHLAGIVPWDKAREVRRLPGVTLHRMVANSYELVNLNQREFPPFRDLRVRRALLHAIDRNLIANTILDSLAPVVHGPIQPVSWAFTDDVRHYDFDPAESRRLLDAAGWRDQDGDGVRERDGDRLSFTLITQAGFVVRENVAQTLQRQFRDIGVDMQIRLIDGTAISTFWFEGRFDAMLHWWHMPADPEMTLFFAGDRTPPAGRNINYFANDDLTRVLYASDRTVDRGERTRYLHEAQRLIADHLPELPLFNVTRLDAVPANLRHFKGNPTNTGIYWNVHEWEIR